MGYHPWGLQSQTQLKRLSTSTVSPVLGSIVLLLLYREEEGACRSSMTPSKSKELTPTLYLQAPALTPAPGASCQSTSVGLDQGCEQGSRRLWMQALAPKG